MEHGRYPQVHAGPSFRAHLCPQMEQQRKPHRDGGRGQNGSGVGRRHGRDEAAVQLPQGAHPGRGLAEQLLLRLLLGRPAHPRVQAGLRQACANLSGSQGKGCTTVKMFRMMECVFEPGNISVVVKPTGSYIPGSGYGTDNSSGVLLSTEVCT